MSLTRNHKISSINFRHKLKSKKTDALQISFSFFKNISMIKFICICIVIVVAIFYFHQILIELIDKGYSFNGPSLEPQKNK